MNIGCIYTVSEDYVSAEKPLLYFSKVPFGLAYIVTSLQKAGHQPEILVFTPETDCESLLNTYIRTARPQLFCCTSVSSEFPFICQIAKLIRQIDPAIPILLGGYHASLNPEQVIQETCFDAVCIGEGEYAAVEYAAQLAARHSNPSQIQNLWIKQREHDSIEKNPCAPFIQDLDVLPFIDRTMWEPWVAETDSSHSVLVGRGCPNACTYCANSALKKITSGTYFRFRSPANIIQELQQLVQDYPAADKISLVADNLSLQLQYTHALCDQLEQFNSKLQRPLQYGICIQPRKALIEDEIFLKKLKAARVQFVMIGLESGSARVRDDILHRPKYANEDMIAFCRLARQFGIAVNLYVMIGIPGETRADFQETIACIRQCNPQHAFPMIFYPFPGTALYEYLEKQRMLSPQMVNHNLIKKKAYFDLPGFSKKQIQREYFLFYYHIFKRKISFYKIVALMLREYLFTQPTFNRLFRKVSMNPYVKALNKKLATNPYGL